MLKRILITIFIVALSFAAGFTQTLNKAKLDSLFDVLLAKNKAMGSVAIARNGRILYTRAIGYSVISPSEKKLATPTTKYRIGSITKMFTAAMVFQLIEEGKLKLTTPVDAFFPALPGAKQITISNLLNHRSGLHNFTDDADFVNWMSKQKTGAEMLAILASEKPDFEPNQKAAYSNSNYVVLGYVIEKITGQTYSKNLHDRITSKLQLANTYVGDKINIKNNESFSYMLLDDWKLQPETDMSIPGGAGSIVSTPADLVKFIQGLFGLKIISASSVLQMKTITDGYGMGMFQIPFYEKKAYGHGGRIDGFESMLSYFPEDSLAVSYMTNGKVYPVNDILIGVLSIYYNRNYAIPTFDVVKVADLDKYVGIYSSKQMPLKISVTETNESLFAQATGQAAFPLEPSGNDVFKFTQAGIVMKFNPVKHEFILQQGGAEYLFAKE